ncbi:hypothetical protein [Kosakonia sacchari]|uniref:hypothetical protein n=1 Tax=Kosakonia sacchari TaxID=1158459 RepID=UPI001584C77C|nr:hypothetical protein [Kosakonia sacchari]NUL35103.1 hypothetical protein [Kosakonia sacchari]
MRNFSAIFRKAWELAREGARKHKGKPKEYFRESLIIVYRENPRHVTARDLAKIMMGRQMTVKEITKEVNDKFINQESKNISRRVASMFRSPHVEIEKNQRGNVVLYLLKSVSKQFFRKSAETRALRAEPKEIKKEIVEEIRPTRFDARDINCMRDANAFHHLRKTGVWIAPEYIGMKNE